MRPLALFCLSVALALHAPALASAAGNNISPAALETINADEIRSDIFFVASDEMRGRDTPSEEQRIVARYIRARLQRLGVAPGAPMGYFFEYPLYLPRLERAATFARWIAAQPAELDLGRDYWFAARRLRDLALEGRVVFCGKGGRVEVEKAQVAGKWALVLDDGGMTGEIERNLGAAGALGALLTPTDDYKSKSYAERFKGNAAALDAARPQYPRERPEEPDKGAGLPFLFLTRPAAQQLWPALAEADAKLPKPGFELDGSFAHARKLVGDGGTVKAEDVCGFWPGSDPVLKSEVILVSAHYDHVGVGRNGEVFNGADDNGSGTCGVLALAEALVTNGPLRRSVMLIWVSGEEHGLWGSQAWTEHPWLPDGARAVCDINMDMIGRNAPDYLMVTPTAALPAHSRLVRIAEELAPLEGFAKLENADRYWERSDQFNYATKLKIPAVFLFNGEHEDYHKSTDDPDKVDCDKIRRVSRLVLRMLGSLQDDKLEL